MANSLLIKSGLVVDGSGNPAYRGDVFIEDGKISSIAPAHRLADKVIDADGLVVAPGFWDIHTHYDAQLLWDPIASSSCWHGVTTVVQGNCGFTIAPCRPEDQDWMLRTLARVEGMDASVLRRTLPWPWEDFGSYLNTLDRALGVNVIPQVGHTAVRRYVMGADASRRPCTEDELGRMKQVVAAAVRSGAMGFTTSRGPSHWDGDGLPVPSRLAALNEYMGLVQELKGSKAGFVQLNYGPDELNPANDEGLEALTEITRVTGRPVCWMTVSRTEQLDAMLALRRQGAPFFAMGQCQPSQFEITFKDTNMFDRFPTFQALLIEPRDKKQSMMRDGGLRQQLKDEMQVDPRGGNRPYNWRGITLASSPSARYRKFETMSVVEIGEAMGKDPLDAAFDIALDEDLETRFRQVNSRDPETMMEIFKAPHVVPGMSDAGAHVISEVNTGFSTRLLGHWVRDQEVLTLEEAVRKLSGAVADELGITDRGYLRDGMAADITIFDPKTVASSDREFVNDLPGGAPRLVQRAAGIEYTLVNGQVTMEHGRHTGELGGKTLRGTDYSR